VVLQVEEWIVVDVTVKVNPRAIGKCQGSFRNARNVGPTRSSSTSDTVASGRVYKRTGEEDIRRIYLVRRGLRQIENDTCCGIYDNSSDQSGNFEVGTHGTESVHEFVGTIIGQKSNEQDGPANMMFSAFIFSRPFLAFSSSIQAGWYQ